jgi:hypothetical protein
MNDTNSAAACSYDLDQQLIITGLGPGWDEFAFENAAAELVSPGPIGQPLMKFVADATTVHLYELLFERAARDKHPVTVPIRCDAPGLRRYLHLTISARPIGGYRVATSLIRAEVRQPVGLLAAHVARRDDHLVMCGWCKRVHVERQWLEVEPAVALLGLFERELPPQITHGICDACQGFLLTMLADDAKLPPP